MAASRRSFLIDDILTTGTSDASAEAASADVAPYEESPACKIRRLSNEGDRIRQKLSVDTVSPPQFLQLTPAREQILGLLALQSSLCASSIPNVAPAQSALLQHMFYQQASSGLNMLNDPNALQISRHPASHALRCLDNQKFIRTLQGISSCRTTTVANCSTLTASSGKSTSSLALPASHKDHHRVLPAAGSKPQIQRSHSLNSEESTTDQSSGCVLLGSDGAFSSVNSAANPGADRSSVRDLDYEEIEVDVGCSEFGDEGTVTSPDPHERDGTAAATATTQSRGGSSQQSSPLDALFKMTSSSFEAAATAKKSIGAPEGDVDASASLDDLLAKNPVAKKKRKSRTAFTNAQIFELEKRFCIQKYLTPADRDDIAQSLNISSAQVITWFQNRRAKLKRDIEELKADVNATTLLSPALSTRIGHNFIGLPPVARTHLQHHPVSVHSIIKAI